MLEGSIVSFGLAVKCSIDRVEKGQGNETLLFWVLGKARF